MQAGVLNQQYKHCVSFKSYDLKFAFFDVASYWPTVVVPQSSKALCFHSKRGLKENVAGDTEINVYFGVYAKYMKNMKPDVLLPQELAV